MHVALVEAREKRNWTVFEAARQAGIGRQSLKDLEDGVIEPGRCRTFVMLKILVCYYPDVSMADFLQEPSFGFRLQRMKNTARG